VGIVGPASVFGAASFVLASLIVSERGRNDWWPLVVASGLAAFSVSLILWRLLCATSPPVSGRRGALAGALTGLLAHPVAWYLALVWNYLLGHASSLGDKPADPLQSIGGSFVMAFWSLLIAGWLTVPAGAIVGFLLARRQAQAGCWSWFWRTSAGITNCKRRLQ
jgi:hypothetical protein